MSRYPFTHTFFSFQNDGKFVGCILIDDGEPYRALQRTYELKINPGGEVFYTSFVMSGDMDMMKAPLDKLLTEEDLKKFGIDFKKGIPSAN